MTALNVLSTNLRIITSSTEEPKSGEAVVRDLHRISGRFLIASAAVWAATYLMYRKNPHSPLLLNMNEGSLAVFIVSASNEGTIVYFQPRTTNEGLIKCCRLVMRAAIAGSIFGAIFAFAIRVNRQGHWQDQLTPRNFPESLMGILSGSAGLAYLRWQENQLPK